MHYIDLIAERPLVWALFGVYIVVTSWLAWLGHKKTGDMKSFAIGKGDMSAVVVGVTLAASIASTATFVVNPGLVYAHGLSALLHLGFAATLGIVAGLVSMSVGFRKLGAKSGAVTLPQWIGQRYQSKVLTVFFALVSLLYLFFVVLIVGALSIIMQKNLGLSNVESLVVIIGFVFGYVFIGGAYAHAYTNTMQGIIMVVIAAIIVGSGIHYFAGGFGAVSDKLAAIDPNLVKATNPASPLYNSYFSVYVSGFVIGFALMCQPHIMTKALFVKSNRDVKRFLAVAIGVGVVFSGMLLVGIYARLSDIPAENLTRFDAVMPVYIIHTFSPTLQAIITVAIMAAAMSTLDGILVALSSICGNDLFLNIAERRWLANASPEDKSRAAHRVSQLLLVGMGVAAFVIALHPPKSLAIFGQVGIYGLVAASTVPILFGILVPSLHRNTAAAAALAGLGGYFGLHFYGFSYNPAVNATCAVFASLFVALAAIAARRLSRASSRTAAAGDAASTPTSASHQLASRRYASNA